MTEHPKYTRLINTVTGISLAVILAAAVALLTSCNATTLRVIDSLPQDHYKNTKPAR